MPVHRNTSARLATPYQSTSQVQDRPSSAPPLLGGNNHQAAQLLRASLSRNKSQANGQNGQSCDGRDGPETKLSRVLDADSSVASAVVTKEDSSEDVSFYVTHSTL